MSEIKDKIDHFNINLHTVICRYLHEIKVKLMRKQKGDHVHGDIQVVCLLPSNSNV